MEGEGKREGGLNKEGESCLEVHGTQNVPETLSGTTKEQTSRTADKLKEVKGDRMLYLWYLLCSVAHTHTCNPSTQCEEPGGPEAQGQP